MGHIGKKLKIKRFKQALRDIADNRAAIKESDQTEPTDDNLKRNGDTSSEVASNNKKSH